MTGYMGDKNKRMNGQNDIAGKLSFNFVTIKKSKLKARQLLNFSKDNLSIEPANQTFGLILLQLAKTTEWFQTSGTGNQLSIYHR